MFDFNAPRKKGDERKVIQKFVNQYYQPSFRDNKYPNLLSISYIPASFNAKHPRILHQHTDAFELLLITSGRGSYYLNSMHYQIKQGDLVFCNSRVLHDEYTAKNENLSYYGIRVANFGVRNLPDNHLIPSYANPIFHIKEHYDDLKQLFEQLFKYADSKYKLEEYCDNLMLSIMTLVMAMYYNQEEIEVDSSKEEEAEESQAVKRIYEIKQYIDDNYHDDLNLERIGKIFNISHYHLSHMYKKVFQIAPIQYLHRRRIGEAQSLLINTTSSITEIAGEVGFGNSNYFALQFKKYVGIPPREYRKIYAQQISEK